MKSKLNTRVALATAAALLFGETAVSTATAAESTLSCFGINTCKGQSACKTARNDCKGQNACKGLGFVELTKRGCEAAKGKTQEPTKKHS
jgi:hypothetical protein